MALVPHSLRCHLSDASFQCVSLYSFIHTVPTTYFIRKHHYALVSGKTGGSPRAFFSTTDVEQKGRARAQSRELCDWVYESVVDFGPNMVINSFRFSLSLSIQTRLKLTHMLFYNIEQTRGSHTHTHDGSDCRLV